MKTLDFLHLDKKNTQPVVEGLQQLLADYQVFYTNLRDYHWNVTGHGFFTLHEQFEKMYVDVATKIDEIAERILMLGGTPESRYSQYLQRTRLGEVSDVRCGTDAVDGLLDMLGAIIAEQRRLIKTAEAAEDAVTVDMLTGYLASQEKLVWIFVAFSTMACCK